MRGKDAVWAALALVAICIVGYIIYQTLLEQDNMSHVDRHLRSIERVRGR